MIHFIYKYFFSIFFQCHLLCILLEWNRLKVKQKINRNPMHRECYYFEYYLLQKLEIVAENLRHAVSYPISYVISRTQNHLIKWKNKQKENTHFFPFVSFGLTMCWSMLYSFLFFLNWKWSIFFRFCRK